MTYVNPNFPTKKALREAVAEDIEVFQPDLERCHADGTVYLEGPHFLKPHRWYAQGTMKDGKLAGAVTADVSKRAPSWWLDHGCMACI
jgi:hypothetical protein